jgi:BirA family transcriptional regulator, biotin operon repressor / biotin---[acetyl-CoA-carboxylase] ligase
MPFPCKNILVLETVDSTNNYAMGLIKNGEALSENAVFAMEQTSGKGRRNKQWKSHKNENIILSIMIEMQWLTVFHQFQLSVAVALGCHDLVSEYVSPGTFIKWPNDIFINDRKAGGVLIENVVKGTLWQWAVIGIGINVNQLDFEGYNFSAASLKKMTGENFEISKLAEELYKLVLKRINDLKAGKFVKMLQEYNEKLFAKNQLVKLKKGNIVFATEITGVSASGQLITEDSFERHFNFDEVEFKGLI